MIADYTWYMIFRETVGEPTATCRSRDGIIDAVAAESVDAAIHIARTRNPVRDSETLEAKPLPPGQWERAQMIRKRRHNANVEFRQLMESMGLIVEGVENDADPI